MKSNWLSYHIFYNKDLDFIIIKLIVPLLESIIKKFSVKQYFFIRYWEDGAHIRLRLLTRNKNDKSDLHNYINNYLENYIGTSNESEIVNYIQSEYTPETARYGGNTGVKIAEKQFYTSSQVILWLIKNSGDWNYNMAFKYSILLNILFLLSFKLNQEEIDSFLNHFTADWINFIFKNPYALKDEFKEEYDHRLSSFNALFIKQKDQLIRIYTEYIVAAKNDSIESPDLLKWLNDNRLIYSLLLKAEKENKITQLDEGFKNLNNPFNDHNFTKWKIYGSYMHMTNNRLGILNQDEAYIAYIVKMIFAEYYIRKNDIERKNP